MEGEDDVTGERAESSYSGSSGKSGQQGLLCFGNMRMAVGGGGAARMAP